MRKGRHTGVFLPLRNVGRQDESAFKMGSYFIFVPYEHRGKSEQKQEQDYAV
jgi:hypothetical protein